MDRAFSPSIRRGVLRRRPTGWPAVTVFASTLLIAPLFLGCTARGGQLLYALGFGRGANIEAQFRLTSEPIMVFVDDIHEKMGWPQAERYVFDELSQALLRNEAAQKIIPLETVDQLRQTVEDFDRRGCRELGELAGASQVLWLEVRDFLADEQIATPSDAAYVSVSVKVIDVTQTESRTRVRLWPMSPDGHIVTVGLAGAEVTEAGSQDKISKALAEELAEEVAKLFYDHRADEPGRG